MASPVGPGRLEVRNQARRTPTCVQPGAWRTKQATGPTGLGEDPCNHPHRTDSEPCSPTRGTGDSAKKKNKMGL